jgi:hypothetical protein
MPDTGMLEEFLAWPGYLLIAGMRHLARRA